MPLEEPSWWYGTNEDDLRIRSLRPIAKFYGQLAKRRFANAKPYRSKLPVICVGNFTAGGTGKTPLSLFIAKLILELGGRPAFLTRGYSGRVKGPAWVNPQIDTADQVGDEPLLLARLAPTLIARNRADGALFIEDSATATHIIMDDGLQNPQLAKSLSIAVVDGGRGLGNGEVIPAGPLRAPLDFQFGLTDAVVVNGQSSGSIGADLRSAFPGPVLSASVRPNADALSLSGERVIAYAGIGNPRRFTDLLESLGADVIATKFFKDHHPFTQADARVLLDMAAAMGARLVTTEKDVVRLNGAEGERKALAGKTTPVGISIAFDDRDRMRLEALISGVHAATKSASAH